MRKSSKNSESLFDKVIKSKLPMWVKSVVVVTIVLTPPLEVLSKLLLAKEARDFTEWLLNLLRGL
jgi:hypothetical protein